MSSVSVTGALASAHVPPPFWRRALAHRSFLLGAILTALLVLAAALSLVWTPWSPYEMDLPSKLQPPSAAHWLGTDTYGRDVVSLLLVGARASILVGMIAVGIGLTIGTALGLLAAAKRGWVEEAGYSGFAEVEIFSEHWWAKPGGEVLDTCIARHQSAV